MSISSSTFTVPHFWMFAYLHSTACLNFHPPSEYHPSRISFTFQVQKVIETMTILPWLIVEFERRGKTSATRRRPVVPFQRRSAGPFSVVIGDLGRTSDRLTVKITCRVTSLCKILLKFSKFIDLTFFSKRWKKSCLISAFPFSSSQ